MNMMYRSNFLTFKDFRYFKLSGMLMGIALLAYLWVKPAGGQPYGGTWLGYLLGILSTLIIFLLMWYGVHKRRTPKVMDRRQYDRSARRKQSSTPTDAQIPVRQRRAADRRKGRSKTSWRFGGTLQGWLSSHVHLGVSLIVLATLHAGFEFGWNVHTLSYVLMLLVIASGFYGLYAYMNFPRQITQNIGEDTLADMLLKIAELDELARIRALGLPDEVNLLVLDARQHTRVGGNFLQQLSGVQPHCPTAYAAKQILNLGEKYIADDQPKLLRDLYAVLLHKEKLLIRARTEIMLKARLEFWLYLHVPLSIALLAALMTHVLAVFFYW